MPLECLFSGSSGACFELRDDSAYYAASPYLVSLNGEPRFNGNTNVFSLFDLAPATSYTLGISREGAPDEELIFQTAPESCAVSVYAFGALGDGITDDTQAIQSAIDFLPRNGRLYFPKGVYLSRPLTLKSHMTMELSENAVLLGSADRSRYPVIPGDAADLSGGEDVNFGGFEGESKPMYQSLLTAAFAEDIAIVGRGTVDGNAQNGDFWTSFRDFAPARPRLLFFHRCNGITVHGITMRNSPSWHLHPHYSKDISVLDVLVTAPKDSPNTDALDPEACDLVRVIGCRFSVGDDCIAVKSGKIDMGKRFRQPAQNHEIRNCLMESGHGAITLGSETAAGVAGLNVERCLFLHTDRGLRIKTRRGRGKFCRITDIVFRDIRMDGVLTPFVINMWYNCCDADRFSEYNRTRNALPVDDRTPRLGRFTFSNIVCSNAEVAACYIDGLPEMPVDEVRFENVSVAFAKDARPGKPAMLCDAKDFCRSGFYLDNVRRAVFKNVTIEGAAGEAVVAAHCDQLEIESLREVHREI